MPRGDREKYLSQFHQGDVQVLCACDILNEGWDCPDVEVLLMARPTLSKVVYMQQLGRGTRRAPGKECLVVVDFVDNSLRYNQAINLHRIVGAPKYRPGGLVLAPEDLKKAEDEALARGERPTAVIDVGFWAKDYQEIDIFNWQEAVANMISVPDLEVELAASEGVVRRAIERQQVQADHTVTLGDRTYHYFRRDRTEEIREALGLPRVEPHNIKDLFLQYADDKMDMSASYKPVMLLALLDCVDNHGRARLADMVATFRSFYESRRAAGLPVERLPARMARVDELSGADVQRVMLDMPFEKFERRRYLRYDRDLAFVRFEPTLWRQLKPDDLIKLRAICQESIKKYYERLGEP
jgi:hypothetical protein